MRTTPSVVRRRRRRPSANVVHAVTDTIAIDGDVRVDPRARSMDFKIHRCVRGFGFAAFAIDGSTADGGYARMGGMCTGYIHDAGVRMGGFFHVRSDVCNPEVGCTTDRRAIGVWPHGDALDAIDANDRRERSTRARSSVYVAFRVRHGGWRRARDRGVIASLVKGYDGEEAAGDCDYGVRGERDRVGVRPRAWSWVEVVVVVGFGGEFGVGVGVVGVYACGAVADAGGERE